MCVRNVYANVSVCTLSVHMYVMNLMPSVTVSCVCVSQCVCVPYNVYAVSAVCEHVYK